MQIIFSKKKTCKCNVEVDTFIGYNKSGKRICVSIILKSERIKKAKILLFASILLIVVLSAIIKCSNEGMQIDTIQHLSDIMWIVIEAIL